MRTHTKLNDFTVAVLKTLSINPSTVLILTLQQPCTIDHKFMGDKHVTFSQRLVDIDYNIQYSFYVTLLDNHGMLSLWTFEVLKDDS